MGCLSTTLVVDLNFLIAGHCFWKSVFLETGGRRHSIRYIHGTTGNTATVTMKAKGGSSQPTSYSDIRACLGHRPLGWELSDFGPDPEDQVSAIERLALDEASLDLVEEARRWRETEDWHRKRGWH